jgi:hypothetical protein
MFHHPLRSPFLKIPAVLLVLFTFAAAKPAPSEKKGSKPELRIVCVSSLSENQEVVLASRDDKGKWQELGTAALRTSLITDWLPAQVGELHLAVREQGTLKSICRFAYPADSRRALAVLIADAEKNIYTATVIDPKKLGFVKGSVLIFNFSPHTGLVSLGPAEKKVEAGQQLVAKSTMEDGGMYRMMVAYLDADGKSVSCYDRQTRGDADSQNLLFLVPDKTLGLRVISLPVFGSPE